MNAVIDFKQKPDAAGAILPCICIDIETANADQVAIDQELALWKAPGNWKPETVEAKREEQATKIREKSALLDSAPVATIGVADENGEVVVFHNLLVEDGHINNLFNGFLSRRATTEAEMCIDFRNWANVCTNCESSIVGFNHISFDLPRLRMAYVRHKLKLPNFLVPRSGNPVADVQYIFGKNFMGKSGAEFTVGLDEVIKRLGIAVEGKQLKGADVPIYVEKGFQSGEMNNQYHVDVIVYNAIDTLLTMRAFLICTGQAGD